jgi:hypothetical protein
MAGPGPGTQQALQQDPKKDDQQQRKIPKMMISNRKGPKRGPDRDSPIVQLLQYSGCLRTVSGYLTGLTLWPGINHNLNDLITTMLHCKKCHLNDLCSKLSFSATIFHSFKFHYSQFATTYFNESELSALTSKFC